MPNSIYSDHYTVDGNVLRICDMEDDHLLNTINLLCRSYQECIRILNSSETITFNASSISSYDEEEVRRLKRNMKSKIKSIIEALPAYTMEALRRPDILQQVFAKINEVFPKDEDIPDYRNMMSCPQLLEEAYCSNYDS